MITRLAMPDAIFMPAAQFWEDTDPLLGARERASSKTDFSGGQREILTQGKQIKAAGILCVFQGFYCAELGQKSRCSDEKYGLVFDLIL